MFTNGGPFSRRLGTFRRAVSQSSAAIQDAYGECFMAFPRVTKPNWPTLPDPSRPIAQIRGTFAWEASNQRLGMEEARVISRTPRLDLDRNDLPWVPKRGDQFLRLETRDLFEVTDVALDGFVGICCELSHLGLHHAEDGPCP